MAVSDLTLELGTTAVDSGSRYMTGFDQTPPTADIIKTNVALFETLPVDGMFYDHKITHPTLGSISGSIVYAMPTALPKTLFATSISDRKTTAHRKFTQNVAVYTFQTPRGRNEPPADWANPLSVSVVQEINFRNFVKSTVEAGDSIIFIDLEPDNSNPAKGWALFKHSDRPGNLTFNDYEKLVYKAGKRYIDIACQEGIKNVVISFGFEQADSKEVDGSGVALPDSQQTYGLLRRLLFGFHDSLKSGTTIHNWRENTYNNYTVHQFNIANNDIDNPASPVPPRYKVTKHGVLYIDYDDDPSKVYDTVDLNNNYFTPARTKEALVLGITRFSEKFYSLRDEEVELFNTSGPTVPLEILQSVKEARIEVGMDYSFDTYLKNDADTICYFEADSINGTLDQVLNDFTDYKGNVFTQPTSGKRYKFKPDAFGTGKKGIAGVAADQTHAICDPIGSLLMAAGASDTGYTIISGQKLAAVTGGTFTTCSFGRSTATSTQISLACTSSSEYVLARADNAGSSPNTPIAGADTSARIVAGVSNGVAYSIFEDNVELQHLAAQDVGAMTLNMFTMGARRLFSGGSINVANYFGGLYSALIVIKRTLSPEEIRAISQMLAYKQGRRLNA